jgi:hypothetical protein
MTQLAAEGPAPPAKRRDRLLVRLTDGTTVTQRLFAFNDGVWAPTSSCDRMSSRSGMANIYRLDNADTA